MLRPTTDPLCRLLTVLTSGPARDIQLLINFVLKGTADFNSLLYAYIKTHNSRKITVSRDELIVNIEEKQHAPHQEEKDPKH